MMTNTAKLTEVREKIKKLLRLGESSNINEAANAAAHAQRLMDKYRIAMIELGDVGEDEEPIEESEEQILAG